MSIEAISALFDVSVGTVHTIIREELKLQKICATSGYFRRTICNKILPILAKNATKTYGMLQTDFRLSCRNQASFFEWHKRFKEGRVSVSDDERCGRGMEVRTPELIGQIKNIMGKDHRVSIETINVSVSVGTVHKIIR